MRKILVLALVSGLGLAPTAFAQRGPLDTCVDRRACDAASDSLILQAKTELSAERHREAARMLYPAVLSKKTSPLARARASNALSDLLEDAELYEYAAVQKGNATAATRAPSSADLLAYARLVAKGGKTEKQKALTRQAYDDVERLAIAAANLTTVDALIGDYTRLGEANKAASLRARRPALQSQFEASCSAIDCKSKPVIAAKVQTLGPVEYPGEARRRLEGDCKVTLNVTESGRPVDLVPDCTDPVFVEAAMIAVQESTFSPRYERGVPKPSYNVVMPFSFQPG